MKHYIYFEGRAAECDTERDFKFGLIGQRSEANEIPKGLTIDEGGLHLIDGRPSAQWTDDEKAAVRTFTITKTDRGRYMTRVLDWFETIADAEAAYPKWEDWINLRIVAVATTIP